MFRLSRPLYQKVLKASTGITGLSVHPNPLPDLRATLQLTLQRLNGIPQHSAYRRATTAIVQNRLDILDRAGEDVGRVEREIDQGQIEEVIAQAQDELRLVDHMGEWKAWEGLEEQAPAGQFGYPGTVTSPS
ncbi:NADH2 dehydrogenase [Hysterangium stoloniferum]|nr:NADH2 dehydrogenase [Hysterangium stoloniferum]